MKIDLTAFIEAGAQSMIGQMQGRMLGQQLAQQQQEQEFNRQINLAQLGANRQQQQNALLTSQFPRMTDESIGQAVTTMGQQPSPYAGLLNTRYARQHPEVGRLLGGVQPPAPAGAPGGFLGAMTGQRPPVAPVQGTAAPGSAPGFTLGGKRYSLKGISKEQIAQRSVQIKATRTLLQNQVAAITDPTVRSHAAGILTDLDGADITTPEGYAAAGQALQRADAAGYTSLGAQGAQQRQTKDIQTQFETEIEKDLAGLNGPALVGALAGHLQTERWIRQQRGKAGYGGKGLESFAKEIEGLGERAKTDPEGAAQQAELIRRAIASPKSAADQGKRIGNFYKALSLWAPTQRTPERVRQIAKNTQNEDLLTGMDDEGLLLGGAAAEKAYQDFIKRISTQNFAGLNKEAQAAMLQEATTLSQYLGRKVSLPAEIVAKLTPWQQAQVGMQRDRIAISGDMRDISRAHLGISRERLKMDRENARIKSLENRGKLTDTERQEIIARRGAVEDARKNLETTMTRLPVLPGNVDLDHPKDDNERAYAALVEKLRQAEDDYVGFMGSLGIQIESVTETGFRPSQAAEKPKTERKTIMGIPYGPEVPVPGQPAAAPETVQAASKRELTKAEVAAQNRQQNTLSARGETEARRFIQQGTPPAPQRAIDLIKQAMGSGDFIGWVDTQPPALQAKAWMLYHWVGMRQSKGKGKR